MNRYIWGKVEPFGIDGFDKLVLPFAFPVFKLLLAGDGLLDIREGLEIDQFVAVVFPGKNADGNGTPRRAFPQSPPQVCRSSRAAYCEAAVQLERRCRIRSGMTGRNYFFDFLRRREEM